MKKDTMRNLLYVGGVVTLVGVVTHVGAIIGLKKINSKIARINDDDNDYHVDGTCKNEDGDTTEDF